MPSPVLRPAAAASLTGRGRWRARLASVLLAACAALPAHAADVDAAQGYAMAMGYVIGQDESLNLIGARFADLKAPAEGARTGFGAAFPDIQSRLYQRLVAQIGADDAQAVEASMRADLREQVAASPLTQDEARAYLAQVAARSRGEIPTPVAEFLLSARYAGDAAQEMADGHLREARFASADNARGVNVRLDLPRSWKATSGQRPEILRRWVSEFGTGSDTTVLDVRPGDAAISHATLEDLVARGELQGMAPVGATVQDAGALVLRTRPALRLRWDQLTERSGVPVYIAATMYQVFAHDDVLSLMCMSAGTPESKATVRAAAERLAHACRVVAESMQVAE